MEMLYRVSRGSLRNRRMWVDMKLKTELELEVWAYSTSVRT